MFSVPAFIRCSILMASLAVAPASRAPAQRSSGTRAEEGWATFYARRRAGKTTASGELYDPRALVAAHPTLPFGTRVRVTRLETGASVIVRVIDRGPSNARRRRGYVIDLSRAAAESLAFVREGRTRVRLDVVRDTSSKRTIDALRGGWPISAYAAIAPS